MNPLQLSTHSIPNLQLFKKENKMELYHLPQLPYKMSALQDLISEQQLDCHYHQHHQKYIDKMNMLLQKEDIHFESLVQFLSDEETGEFFNHAAQAWNHTFYWNSMSPEKQNPSDFFLKILRQGKKDLEELKNLFFEKGTSLFGSGWVWIVLNPQNQIDIMGTRNAKVPLALHYTPLIVADVWEHAYYLDYQSSRKEYLEKFWNHINWEWADQILKNKNHLHQVERLMKESEG